MRIICLISAQLLCLVACSGSRQNEGNESGVTGDSAVSATVADTLTDAQQKSACTDTILVEWAGLDAAKVDMDTLNFDDIETLLGEDHTSHVSTELVRAPDDRFIAVTVVMEGCGAYCNPNYDNWFIVPGKMQLRSSVGAVDKIHKLGENKYLLMISSHGKPAGYYSEECYSARILSLDDKAMWFDALLAPEGSGPQPNHNSEFSACQPSFVDPGEGYPYMRFDPDKGKLSYGFAFQYDFQLDQGIDDTLVTGELIWEEGTFRRGNETRKAIPPMEFD